MNNLFKKTDKKFWIKIGALATVSILGWVLFVISLNASVEKNIEDSSPDSPNQITNYEECVAAGNPIMETFPEQCLTENGEVFVNDGTEGGDREQTDDNTVPPTPLDNDATSTSADDNSSQQEDSDDPEDPEDGLYEHINGDGPTIVGTTTSEAVIYVKHDFEVPTTDNDTCEIVFTSSEGDMFTRNSNGVDCDGSVPLQSFSNIIAMSGNPIKEVRITTEYKYIDGNGMVRRQSDAYSIVTKCSTNSESKVTCEYSRVISVNYGPWQTWTSN